MPFVVGLERPGRIALRSYDDPPLAGGEVRLRTLYSGISAGTELSLYRGSNPYLHRRWDPSTRLFDDSGASVEYPVETWGYEEVGRVEEVGLGVTAVRPGDLVHGAWGHRSSTTVTEAWAAQRRLDPRIPPRSGVFARMGAIGLNAVLDAGLHLGETAAVFGCGVLGLLVVQMAAASGASVVAVDVVPERLALAEQLGAVRAIDASEGGAAEAIKDLTGGRGADVAIEVSGLYPVLHEAIRATAYGSRVVSSGFLQGEGTGLRLGDEFHHNRIEVVCSQISGVHPSLAHRWDRDRLEEVFLRLLAEARVEVARLVTHVVPAQEAADAYALLDARTPDVLQVVLAFAPEEGP